MTKRARGRALQHSGVCIRIGRCILSLYPGYPCIVLYSIVLHCIALYCIELYCIVNVLHCKCIVLYCIVLHCIALHCIANCKCIVLHCIVFLELGDAFSVYLLDTHDGNSADDRADISAGSIIPYEQELINMHGGYNKYTGTNIYHIKG